MTVKEVLIAARKRIEKEENWAKGGYGTSEGPNCVVGALMQVRRGLGWDGERRLGTIIAATVPKQYRGDVVFFNDAPETTHGDVLAFLDEAIASCA